MRLGLILAVSSVCASAPALAQSEAHEILQELRAAPQPKQQNDLDTFQLASAHRERARSMQEKTNGLWQSWLVSVCQGCGSDRKTAQEFKLEDDPSIIDQKTTGSIEGHAAPPKPSRDTAAPAKPRSHGSLASDLSPENVGSIRRMPAQ